MNNLIIDRIVSMEHIKIPIDIPSNYTIENEPTNDNDIINDIGTDDEKSVEVKANQHLDNPWNYRIVMFLRKLGKKTMGYRWMHDKESEINDKRGDKYKLIESWLIGILGIFASVEFVGLASSENFRDNNAVLIISCLQLLFIFLLSIVKVYREVSEFEKKKLDHHYISFKFGEINLAIQNQLTIPVSNRDTDTIFLRYITKSFTDLMYSAPTISDDTKKSYIDGSSDPSDVFNPMTDEDGNIQIVIDEGPQQQLYKTMNKPDDMMKYQVDRWLSRY